MSVSPSEEIVVTYVHSSGVADLSVNDDNLPVVAIVELRQQECIGVGESYDFHSCLLHFVVIAWPDGDVGYVLMDEPDLDAFACLLHQKVLYAPASVVLEEIEIFEMNMMPGGKNVVDKGFELAPARGDDLYLVVAAYGQPAVAAQQTAELPVAGEYPVFVCISEQQFLGLLPGALVEYIQEFPVTDLEESRFPEIQPEYKVKYESYYRQYAYNQNPGNLSA